MSKRWLFWIAVLAVFGLVVAACGDDDSSAEAADTSDTTSPTTGQGAPDIAPGTAYSTRYTIRIIAANNVDAPIGMLRPKIPRGSAA